MYVSIEYCSQVSHLHRSSLLPVDLLLHSVFLSAIQLGAKRSSISLYSDVHCSTLVPSQLLTYTDLHS